MHVAKAKQLELESLKEYCEHSTHKYISSPPVTFSVLRALLISDSAYNNHKDDNAYPSGSNKREGQDIIRSKGNFPPGSFTFKIESFSLLSKILRNTGVEKVESSVFESGGHKWKLVLYPYGDTKRNGNGYISLYLALVDDNVIPDGFVLQVSFKFFVYDQIQDNYLIIKDNTVKRYHSSRKEHGFHQLLPLSIFKDPLNGYLLNDSCVFGVEIHVFNMPCKGEKFKLIKNPPNGTFTWKIVKFSTLKQERVSSQVFTVAGHKWKVVLYPRGSPGSPEKENVMWINI